MRELRLSFIFLFILAGIVFYFVPSARNAPLKGDDTFDYSKFDRSFIPVGEKLMYEAYMFGKLLPIGKVTLEIQQVEKDGKKYYLFKGNTVGGYLVFEVKIDLESYVDYESLKPQYYIRKQTGFEQRIRKTIFDWQTKQLYYYEEGLFSDRLKKVGQSIILPHTRDVLSTIYFARDLEPVLHNKKIMRFTEKQDVWTVSVEMAEKKQIQLPNGKKHEVILVKINPLRKMKPDKKAFSGLFGLEGKIFLWVTPDKRIPLMIEGDYSFSIIKLRVKVILKEWEPANLISFN